MRIRTTWLLAAFAALFIGTSCFGQPVAAATVERGPYLQIATPTGIVLRWRTEGADPATTSVVNYGTTLGALGSSADAAPQQAVVLDTDNVDRTVTEHEVALTGLAPNTRYYYDVGDESGVNAGGDATYSFVTPPIIGTAQATRIWAIGDSGTANSDAMAVRDAYKAKVAAEGRPTDLWLMLGDNAYNDGKDYQYQAAVFDMYPEILRQAPVWPTRGNHDKAFVTPNDGPIAAYYDIFTLPTAGEAGGLSSGTEAYYSFDHANIHFIVLDSFGSSNAPGSAMLSWLENDLMSTSQDWVIAYWHHPPYTKGSHNSDTESRLIEMRENALPILEEYGVDLVLGGHSHSYERSFLLTGHYDVSGTLAPSMVLDNGDGREGGDGAYFKDGSAPLANDGAEPPGDVLFDQEPRLGRARHRRQPARRGVHQPDGRRARQLHHDQRRHRVRIRLLGHRLGDGQRRHAEAAGCTDLRRIGQREGQELVRLDDRHGARPRRLADRRRDGHRPMDARAARRWRLEQPQSGRCDHQQRGSVRHDVVEAARVIGRRVPLHREHRQPRQRHARPGTLDPY